MYRIIKEKIQSLLEDEVYKGVSEIDKDLIVGFEKSTHTFDDVKRCLKILIEYERTLNNLINLVNVDSEYEVYSGNFSTSRDKVKAFGKNRLISSILSLREKFYNNFMDGFENDDKKYCNCQDEKHLKYSRYFSEQIELKAQLFYLISYMYKFPEIQINEPYFEKLKAEVLSALDSLKIFNREGKFCGFIWFIIPKIIINLKISVKMEKEKETEKSHSFMQN